MKLAAKVSNTSVLHFNDLGADIKGVSPQEKMIALAPGEAVYIPNQSGVLFSAWQGDAKRYQAAGLLDVNDDVVLANAGTFDVMHNFNFLPTVTVNKLVGGVWTLAVNGTDYTAVTNAVMTTTTITNISGGQLEFMIMVG